MFENIRSVGKFIKLPYDNRTAPGDSFWLYVEKGLPTQPFYVSTRVPRRVLTLINTAQKAIYLKKKKDDDGWQPLMNWRESITQTFKRDIKLKRIKINITNVTAWRNGAPCIMLYIEHHKKNLMNYIHSI